MWIFRRMLCEWSKSQSSTQIYIYFFLLSYPMTVAVQARQCKLQVCLFRYLSDQTRLLSDFWCPPARSGGSEPSSCWPRPTRLWMRPSACPSNMRCPLPSWQMHPSTCWNAPASQALRWQVNISLSTRCSAAVYYNFFWHQCTSSLSCSFLFNHWLIVYLKHVVTNDKRDTKDPITTATVSISKNG